MMLILFQWASIVRKGNLMLYVVVLDIFFSSSSSSLGQCRQAYGRHVYMFVPGFS